MKYLFILVAVIASFFITPSATAQEPVTVTNGMRWNTLEQPSKLPLFDWCSIAAVGYDSNGDKVALSAGHCIKNEPLNAPVYLYDNRAAGPIGVLSTRNVELDYVIIKLNPSVHIASNGPRARVDSIGTDDPRGITCKDGATTGVTCGLVLSQSDTRLYTTGPMFSGDSGGSIIYQGTKLIGINRAMTLKGFEYVKATAILADLQARGNVTGNGFTPVNN